MLINHASEQLICTKQRAHQQWLYKYRPYFLLTHMVTKIQAVRDMEKTISVFNSSIRSQWWCWPKCLITTYGVGQETQDIYDTLNVEEREVYKTSLEALDQHFCIKKNIPFKRSICPAAKQLEKELTEQYITQLQQLAQYCE